MPTATINSLPSVLLELIFQFAYSRSVVCVCTRVSHAWYSAATHPHSAPLALPSNDNGEDDIDLLSSCSITPWPWHTFKSVPKGFRGYTRDCAFVMKPEERIAQYNSRLALITSPSFKFLHHIRTWHSIPFQPDFITRTETVTEDHDFCPRVEEVTTVTPQANVKVEFVVKLKYLQTLHIAGSSDLTIVENLFKTRPFPFASLRSLSLPFLTSSLIHAMPELSELRRLILTERFGGISLSDWSEFSKKFPRLSSLELSSTVQIDEKINIGVLELIRGCGETLRKLKCAGVFQKEVLARLIDEKLVNTSLRELHDIGRVAPVKRSDQLLRTAFDLNDVRLTDEVLTELVKLPSLTYVTQPYTWLTSISILAGIGTRLQELTISSQPLFDTLTDEFRTVFPQLLVLHTLTIGCLKSSQEYNKTSNTIPTPPSHQVQQEDEVRYCELLLSIRTLPKLRKLVLERVPLVRKHLDVLLGVDIKGNVLEGERYFLTDTTQSGLLELEELHLFSINSFHDPEELARNPNPLITLPPDGLARTVDLEKGRIGMERLAHEKVLHKSCKLVMRYCMGVNEDGKKMLKEYFQRGGIE